MIEDVALLRAYAEQQSEPAFAELVQRRVGLVYGIALRQVGGDAHLAQDATQKVFVKLARHAAALTGRPAIGGWLYRTAHHTAVDLVRAERRRRAREQQSELMSEPLENSPSAATNWDALRPLLDDAMSALSDRDRDAVALRFFEGRAFAEVGRALRLTEEAARKRVDRALDTLAATLERRGVKSTSAALAVVLGEQAAMAAPAGLAATVTGTALVGASVGAGWTWWSFLSSTKVTLILGGAAVLAAGVALNESQRARMTQAELQSSMFVQQDLRQQVDRVQRSLSAVEQRAQAAEEDNARLLTAIDSVRASREANAAAAQKAAASPMKIEPKNKEDETATPRVHVRVIQLSRTEGVTDAHLMNQAGLVLTRWRNGESFAKLAQEFSSDPRRARGGDWGWQGPADFKPSFRDVVFNLQKGQASAPVLLPEGCFIVYAEERK